jgi:hypothetical protein
MILLAEQARLHEHSHQPSGTPAGLIVACVIGAVLVAIVGRIVTHALDRGRIARYAQEKGWQILDCRWRLLGPGWFGSRNERIYRLSYRDAQGRTHDAFAKTSALAGVYLTEDRVTDGSAG